MDAAGLVVGLPGLIQTCVHGYRFVCIMIDLDRTAAVMRLRYRIEESRLALWARYWGLLDAENNTESKAGTQNFDDLLAIPGIKALINDILEEILASLEDVRKLSQKYHGAELSIPSNNANGTSGQNKSGSSTASKLKWAIKDRDCFELTLTSLTSLNDGLEQLLPRRQRVALEQALVGEVLAEEKIRPGDEESEKLAAAFDGTDMEARDHQPGKVQCRSQEAKMISATSIQNDSWTSRRTGRYSKHSEYSNDPWQEEMEDAEGGDQEIVRSDKVLLSSSMQLPLPWFVGLIGKRKGFSIESIRLPLGFEPGTISTAKFADQEEEVFLEWRNYDDSLLDAQLQMALDARREEVSRLFHRRTNQSSHCVMQCLGFVRPDDSTMGLVFRTPIKNPGQPISLYEMMHNDFESASAVVPDLEERLTLSKKLATALYELQCSGWLHRQISSHNVMFFPSSTENGRASISLSHPSLVGWQTARYDDQVSQQHSEGTYVWRKNKWKLSELPYVHPSRPAARTRFKRSFDVYSLGVVLAEIAFWEPIEVLGGQELKTMFSRMDKHAQSSDATQLQTFSDIVISTCKAELAAEVGRNYQSAVVWALEGVKAWYAQQAADRYDVSEEELNKEIGLEKAFFWNVVNPLSNAPLGV